MKIKIRELIEGFGSLSKISALPVNTALKFRLGRVFKQVKKLLDDIQEKRLELINREGGTLPDGTNEYIFPTKEAESTVNKEWQDLLNLEVNITFDTFAEDTFEKLEISSIDIASVLWLFGDEELKNTPEIIEK